MRYFTFFVLSSKSDIYLLYSLAIYKCSNSHVGSVITLLEGAVVVRFGYSACTDKLRNRPTGCGGRIPLGQHRATENLADEWESKNQQG